MEFLRQAAIGSAVVLVLTFVLACSREIMWAVEWGTDQIKRRWRDR